MKRVFYAVLVIEAVVCVWLCFAKEMIEGVFTAIVAFPFEQIGYGLRLLSLSGTKGNAAAVAIYIVVSLVPCAMLLVIIKRRKLKAEDSLLVLLSGVLFAVLYFMVNPGAFPVMKSITDSSAIVKSMLGVGAHSVLFGYIVLRMLRLFFKGESVEHYMGVMLSILSMLFVYMAFGATLADTLSAYDALLEGNKGNESLLGMTYIFFGLRYVVNALPYILNTFVVFAARRMLDEQAKDRYSESAVAATQKMSRTCAAALVITTISSIMLNLLQLLASQRLMVINTTVNIPIFSVLFVLAALLFTRSIADNKKLKDENDSYI